MEQPATAKSLVAVNDPSVAWQVYVPVPEVSYPVSATTVHDVPAARESVPTVQPPVASLYPRTGIVHAGGVAQSAPVYELEHVHVVVLAPKLAVASVPVPLVHVVHTPVAASVPADW